MGDYEGVSMIYDSKARLNRVVKRAHGKRFSHENFILREFRFSLLRVVIGQLLELRI